MLFTKRNLEQQYKCIIHVKFSVTGTNHFNTKHWMNQHVTCIDSNSVAFIYYIEYQKDKHFMNVFLFFNVQDRKLQYSQTR